MTIDKIGKLLTMRQLYIEYEKRLICCTYNITHDRPEYLTPEEYPDLPCLIALRMSSNLPLIFENFKYMDNFYIDGGIADNFPIDRGEMEGEKVLAFLTQFKHDSFGDITDGKILDYIYKIMFIPITQSVEYRIRKTTRKSTIIRLAYSGVKFFNFDISSTTRLDMFSCGYQTTKSFFEK
jgi:predicted acylesterase/phospholipase RssA